MPAWNQAYAPDLMIRFWRVQCWVTAPGHEELGQAVLGIALSHKELPDGSAVQLHLQKQYVHVSKTAHPASS